MKLGISSYSFTWATGVKDSIPEKRFNETNLLNTARELELELVQIADNMPLHEMTEEQVHTLFETAGNLQIAIEVGANDLTAANLEHYIHLADKLKSKILRFSIDGKDHKPGVKEVIAIIRNTLPELQKRGRLFTSDFREIMEAVGNSYVGICLDCANSLGVGEGFHEVVTALAPYTVNFHLKEVYIKRKSHMMGFEIEGRPFGEGCLPLQWMLEQLPPTCRTAILEQWTPPEADIQKDN
jgi:sugar phosphate isomerase/epimerase